MNEQEKVIWAAGFIEGDGTIRIAKNKTFQKKNGSISNYINPWIAVGQTRSMKNLEELKTLFGGNIYEDKSHNPLSNKRKFKWVITGKAAYQVMLKLEPYIIDRPELQKCLKLLRKD